MATVKDLIATLQMRDSAREVGSISQYLDLIQKANLGDFIKDASVLAGLLTDLVKPVVSYGEGGFYAHDDNSLSFDDNEGGYDFPCEIQIDEVSETYLIWLDSREESWTFKTVQELADFLNDSW